MPDLQSLISFHLQHVALGCYADLEVLKFAERGCTFHWKKIGSRCPVQPSTDPNVLVFPCISEKDLGYYQCEVKERGKAVLTAYRALYSKSDFEQYVCA